MKWGAGQKPWRKKKELEQEGEVKGERTRNIERGNKKERVQETKE